MAACLKRFTRLFPAALLGLSLNAMAADWQYLTEPGDTLIGIGKR